MKREILKDELNDVLKVFWESRKEKCRADLPSVEYGSGEYKALSELEQTKWDLAYWQFKDLSEKMGCSCSFLYDVANLTLNEYWRINWDECKKNENAEELIFDFFNDEKNEKKFFADVKKILKVLQVVVFD